MATRGQMAKTGLGLSLLLGLVGLLASLSAHHPVTAWLTWRYVPVVLSTAAFVGSTSAAGLWVARALRPAEGLDEVALSLAFPLGLLVFNALMLVLGLTGAFGAAFVGAPLLLLLAGRRELPALAARWAERREREPWSWLDVAVSGLGALGLLMLYLPALLPENASFDAHWYHLALAERYAVERGLVPLSEGFVAGGYPQLATMAYTWAFLLPWGSLFDRVVLSSHLEMATVAWAIFSVPVLVKRLAPGVRGRRLWPAFFLFPAFFAYDSAPACGADHFAALFAVPIALSVIEAWQRPSPRSFALAAACMGGALATKVTASSIAFYPAAALALRVVASVARRNHLAAARSALGWLGAAALSLGLTAAPMAVRNWLFYHDPVYPMLARTFGARPWGPQADEWLERFFALRFIPGAERPHGWPEVPGFVATFWYRGHDWPAFHGDAPTFGALFAVATLALPFVGSRRSWALAAGAYAAVVAWGWVPQDRYLQIPLPWMVAITAQVIASAWRAGALHRGLLVALMAVQSIWGVSVYFFAAHAMTHKAPLVALSARFEQGAAAWQSPARGTYAPFADIAPALPPSARVLLHDENLSLGLGVPVISDALPYQMGLDYGALGDPQAVHDALKRLSVTHVILTRSPRVPGDTLAGDLVFRAYLARHGRAPRSFGPRTLVELAEARPARSSPGLVRVEACGDQAPLSGLYALADLAKPPSGDGPNPAIPEAPRLSPDRDPGPVDYLVRDASCGQAPPPADFASLGLRGRYLLMARGAEAGSLGN